MLLLGTGGGKHNQSSRSDRLQLDLNQITLNDRFEGAKRKRRSKRNRCNSRPFDPLFHTPSELRYVGGQSGDLAT